MAGRLIVSEAIEAAGKGVNSLAIMKWFESRGMPALHTREPGGTPYAERLREILLSKDYNSPSISDALGFYAARCDHTQNLILPALQNDVHVLCERYSTSSLVYQASLPEIQSIHEICKPYLVEPDLVLFLSISAETSVERMEKRRIEKNIPLDKFESKGIDYLNQVRENYLRQSKEESGNLKPNWRIIDAEQPLEQVVADIYKVLDDFFQVG